ncbi:MAG: GAF domain-containing protein [Pseudomonadota bacterium]
MSHPTTPLPSGADAATLYAHLLQSLDGLLAGERDPIANLANAAALLWATLPELNWAGFYLLRGDELVVGPFQGKPACVRISLDRGVCGAAAREQRTQIVADVHAFAGHIACDAASNSEIVVPLVRDGRLLGVMDLDSPVPGRFADEDGRGLEAFAARLVAGSDL